MSPSMMRLAVSHVETWLDEGRAPRRRRSTGASRAVRRRGSPLHPRVSAALAAAAARAQVDRGQLLAVCHHAAAMPAPAI